MTAPTIVPVEYDISSRDYLKVKQDRSGASRIYAGQISIPAATVSGATVGLIPFNKGARFAIGNNSIFIDDVDTSTNVTCSVGYIYDDNVTYTNNLVAWVSASTVPQASGFLTVNNKQGLTFDASANGWVVLQILSASTTTTGNVQFQIDGSYDGLGIDNQNNQN